MSVTHVEKDLEACTMTMTVLVDAPVERVWQVWADPRLLEKWWGPPSYPATFVEYDLTPGRRMRYFMTSPEGEQFHGWWRILAVDAPQSLELEDGFADNAGNPNPDLPVTVMRMTLEADGEGTRMVLRSQFASRAGMEQIIEMGVEEGMTHAVNQIDALVST